MSNLKQYIYSSVFDNYTQCGSKELERYFLDTVANSVPKFSASECGIGSSCMFQMTINNNYVGVGRTESVMSDCKRPIVHTHVVLLTAEEYTWIGLPYKALWENDNGFINYKKFLKKYSEKYPDINDLDPLEINPCPDAIPEFEFMRNIYKTKDKLTCLLSGIFLPESLDRSGVFLEIEDMESAIRTLFSTLSLLPVEMRPYISFLVGMQPEHSGKFNFVVKIGQSNQLSQIQSGAVKSELFNDLSTAVFDQSEDKIKDYHKQFNDILTYISLPYDLSDNRQLIIKALERYPNVEKEKNLFIKRVENLSDSDMGKVLSLLENVPESFGFEAKKKLKDKIDQLKQKNEFLSYVKKQRAGISNLYTRDQVLCYVEEFLRLGKVSSGELDFLFSEAEYKEPTPDTYPWIFIELKRLEWRIFLKESLTKNGIRKNPHLVEVLVQEAVERAKKYEQSFIISVKTQPSNRNVPDFRSGLIQDVANAVQNLNFDIREEITLLLDWETEDKSLFYIYPRLILGDLKQYANEDVSRELVTKYFERFDEGRKGIEQYARTRFEKILEVRINKLKIELEKNNKKGQRNHYPVEKPAPPASKEFSLIAQVNPANSGFISIIPDRNGFYKEDALVTVCAEANSGYRFDHWHGDIDAGHDKYDRFSFNMNSDKRFIANFESKLHAKPSFKDVNLGKLLLEDNFSDKTVGWETYVKIPAEEANNQNDGYHLVSSLKRINLIWAKKMSPISSFGLQVTIRKIDGPENIGYGLVYNMNIRQGLTKRYYEYNLFCITGDGEYRAYQYMGKEDRFVNLTTYKSEYINTKNAVNNLTLFSNDCKIELFVNGRYLNTLNAEKGSGGTIGICAMTGKGLHIVFSNIFVYELNAAKVSVKQPEKLR